MQTECVRCHKMIDTVQGYKFSPTEYVCMSCYDEFKAERVAKARKQHKNPLLDQYGAERPAQAAQAPPSDPGTAAPPQQRQQPVQPPHPKQPEPAVPSGPQMFAPKAAPKAPTAEAPPSADTCDVCRQPIPDFKVPLKGGKKVCMGCNDILREVAKSLVLNVQCPHCGKDVQLTAE